MPHRSWPNRPRKHGTALRQHALRDMLSRPGKGPPSNGSQSGQGTAAMQFAAMQVAMQIETTDSSDEVRHIRRTMNPGTRAQEPQDVRPRQPAAVNAPRCIDSSGPDGSRGAGTDASWCRQHGHAASPSGEDATRSPFLGWPWQTPPRGSTHRPGILWHGRHCGGNAAASCPQMTLDRADTQRQACQAARRHSTGFGSGRPPVNRQG